MKLVDAQTIQSRTGLPRGREKDDFAAGKGESIRCNRLNETRIQADLAQAQTDKREAALQEEEARLALEQATATLNDLQTQPRHRSSISSTPKRLRTLKHALPRPQST